MHIAITNFRLNSGTTEADLLAASEKVHHDFETAHDGMLKRILVKDHDGAYADIDFFTDEQAMSQVMAAAEADPACGVYFEMMDLAGEPVVYEVVQSYQQ